MKLSRVNMERVREAAREPHDGTKNVSVHIEEKGRAYNLHFTKTYGSVPGATSIAENVPQAAVKNLKSLSGRVSAKEITAMFRELDKLV